MAFVNRYDHDVFVSYGHVDNQPDPDVSDGWVSALIKRLRIRLAEKLARADACSIWMDDRLQRESRSVAEITRIAERSATLLVILSPGYLASEWCEQERAAFVRTMGGRPRFRVFIVERDRVDVAERPEEFRHQLPYKFWVQDGSGPPRILGTPRPHPEETAYYVKLTDLAYDLAQHLQLLRGPTTQSKPAASMAAKPAPPASPAVPERPIFLAEVTEDLDPLRDEVRRYLSHHGIIVRPDRFYPREMNAFREAVDHDLAASSFFVQLLGRHAGEALTGDERTASIVQHERAIANRKPVIQWRPPGLSPSEIEDPVHRAQLDGVNVLSIELDDFKREILRRRQREQAVAAAAPAASKGSAPLVFVNAGRNDRLIAQHICDELERQGMGYARPLPNGEPDEIRTDLEANLIACDGLIVVYGTTGSTWVREQLRRWQRVIYRRDKPLRALAVCEAPPPEKEPLEFRLPRMLTLDFRVGWDRGRLTPFFQAFEEETSS